jgi:hypothetical protein
MPHDSTAHDRPTLVVLDDGAKGTTGSTTGPLEVPAMSDATVRRLSLFDDEGPLPDDAA